MSCPCVRRPPRHYFGLVGQKLTVSSGGQTDIKGNKAIAILWQLGFILNTLVVS